MTFGTLFKNITGKKKVLPNIIDNTVGDHDIADSFANKFKLLYNFVGYTKYDFKLVYNFVGYTKYDFKLVYNFVGYTKYDFKL